MGTCRDASTMQQQSLFETEIELPFIWYTSTERKGQGFSSPMSQMRQKKYCRVSFDNVSFNVFVDDIKKLHAILIYGFNNGISFAETFHRLIKNENSNTRFKLS